MPYPFDPDQIVIGVMGAYDCDEQTYQLAREVGQLIAQRQAILLTGGRSGVMEGAAHGAHEAGGLSLGVLKGTNRNESKPNPYVHIALRTGFGDARNLINIAAADGIIAIAGGYGTLSEIALAMKMNKPLVLLKSWQLDNTAPQEVAKIPTADSPQQAVELLFQMIESQN